MELYRHICIGTCIRDSFIKSLCGHIGYSEIRIISLGHPFRKIVRGLHKNCDNNNKIVTYVNRSFRFEQRLRKVDNTNMGQRCVVKEDDTKSTVLDLLFKSIGSSESIP